MLGIYTDWDSLPKPEGGCAVRVESWRVVFDADELKTMGMQWDTVRTKENTALLKAKAREALQASDKLSDAQKLRLSLNGASPEPAHQQSEPDDSE